MSTGWRRFLGTCHEDFPCWPWPRRNRQWQWWSQSLLWEEVLRNLQMREVFGVGGSDCGYLKSKKLWIFGLSLTSNSSERSWRLSVSLQQRHWATTWADWCAVQSLSYNDCDIETSQWSWATGVCVLFVTVHSLRSAHAGFKIEMEFLVFDQNMHYSWTNKYARLGYELPQL